MPGPALLLGSEGRALNPVWLPSRVVAQYVGVMILAGEQHGFNWKGVALGAVGGAISGGLAGAGIGSSLNPIGAGMVRGAIGSAATQGVALASGMQQRFDWRGVGASAIAGGIGAGIDKTAGAAKWSPLARQVSSGLGAGLASVGVRGDLSAQSLEYAAADSGEYEWGIGGHGEPRRILIPIAPY